MFRAKLLPILKLNFVTPPLRKFEFLRAEERQPRNSFCKENMLQSLIFMFGFQGLEIFLSWRKISILLKNEFLKAIISLHIFHHTFQVGHPPLNTAVRSFVSQLVRSFVSCPQFGTKCPKPEIKCPKLGTVFQQVQKICPNISLGWNNMSHGQDMF